MTVHLVFPTLPPVIDGIGAYTARFAEALAPQADVTILTAAADADVAPSVRVCPQAFSLTAPDGFGRLADRVRADTPDWLVVQYNPFSYGRWGFAPGLHRALHRLRADRPALRIAVMVHEPFLPLDTWRWAVMTTWQRWQLWQLGRAADVLFFSIAAWAERFRSWFPTTPVHHLPVGSNMPPADTTRDAMRMELGLPATTFLAGVFGSGHPSRLLPFVRAATDRLRSLHPDVRVLYIGADGDRVQAALGDTPLLDVGPLPDHDVARHFTAMDLYLAPFRKGVSTRRGSFLAGLQQGIATVSTHGVHTDPLLRDADGRAFLLAPDDDPAAYAAHAVALSQDTPRRAAIGAAGAAFFHDTFTWSALADRFLHCLPSVSERAPA